MHATVSELIAFPRPAISPWPRFNRVDAELQTYVVRAFLAGVREQDDMDVHLLLRDPNNPNAVMIAEIPDSSCVITSPRKGSLYAQARRAMRAVPRDGLVEVTGIAYFDSDHRQRFSAPNGIELHPVLRLTPLDSTRRQPVGLLSLPSDSLRLADSVWVNTSSRVYHCPGTQYYGKTSRGYFTSEQEAQRAGARPAGGRRCQVNR